MPLVWLIMASMTNILFYTYSLKEVAKNTLISNPVENWKVPLHSWLEIKVKFQFSPKNFLFTQGGGARWWKGGGVWGWKSQEFFHLGLVLTFEHTCWSWYWVLQLNFHTHQVVVLGTYNKTFHADLVLVLGSRLLFGWYDAGIYP
jgi:hypothetical protein